LDYFGWNKYNFFYLAADYKILVWAIETNVTSTTNYPSIAPPPTNKTPLPSESSS
jgi:hypothetical protein